MVGESGAVKLESHHSADDRRLWKIVRTDSLKDVPCDEIISADETTGECEIKIGEEVKKLSLGPGGIKLTGRGRR